MFKPQLDSISHKQLNAKCLVQISNFARTLYQFDGSILKLKDENIIEQIANISNNTSNIELKAIYTQLQLEILDIVCETDDIGEPSNQAFNNAQLTPK